MAGSFYRAKLKYHAFLRKQSATNPTKSSTRHFVVPLPVFSGVPFVEWFLKTARGATALERMKVFEGIPAPSDKMKRMVVPAALRVLRLKPGRRFTTLGVWANSRLEVPNRPQKDLEVHKETSAAYFKKKKAAKAAFKQTLFAKASQLEKVNKSLSEQFTKLALGLRFIGLWGIKEIFISSSL